MTTKTPPDHESLGIDPYERNWMRLSIILIVLFGVAIAVAGFALVTGVRPLLRHVPPAPAARAAYYRWLFFAAGPLEAAILNHSLGFEVAPEQQMAAGYGSYETAMDMLEKAVPETGFLCGEQFTAADVYVGSQINFGLEFGIIDKRAAFRRYSERLKARPAFARAAELDAAAAG